MKTVLLFQDPVTNRLFKNRHKPRKPGFLAKTHASFRKLTDLPVERLMLLLFAWFLLLTTAWAIFAYLTH